MVFQSEECLANRLQSEGLDDWPFLNYLHFLIGLEIEPYLARLRHCSIEKCYFQDLELVFAAILLVSWAEDCAVGQGVYEMVNLSLGRRSHEDEGFSVAGEYDHFCEDGVEVSIG